MGLNMRSVRGAVFVGVLLLTATVGLLAFAHVTASALRLLAAANGVEQLQVEAALDAAALVTREELSRFVAPPHPETLPEFGFEEIVVTRILTWQDQGSSLLAHVQFVAHGAARNISYIVRPEQATFYSYQ